MCRRSPCGTRLGNAEKVDADKFKRCGGDSSFRCGSWGWVSLAGIFRQSNIGERCLRRLEKTLSVTVRDGTDGWCRGGGRARSPQPAQSPNAAPAAKAIGNPRGAAEVDEIHGSFYPDLALRPRGCSVHHLIAATDFDSTPTLGTSAFRRPSELRLGGGWTVELARALKTGMSVFGPSARPPAACRVIAFALEEQQVNGPARTSRGDGPPGGYGRASAPWSGPRRNRPRAT
jgi:hypothetical protein